MAEFPYIKTVNPETGEVIVFDSFHDKVARDTLFGVTEPEPVETVSITNLVPNPHFNDGLGNWYSGWKASTQEVVDGVLYMHDFTSDDSVRHLLIRQDVLVIGHRYYVSARVKVDGAFKAVKANFTGWGAKREDEVSTQPTAGEWGYATTMATLSDLTGGNGGNAFDVLISFNSTAQAQAASVYVDDAVVIDLTATFGEGNLPDLATMDRWMQEQFPNGFEGTETLALTAEDDGDEGDTGAGGLVGQVAALEKTVAGLKTGSITQTGTVYPVLESYYIANFEEARPVYYNAQGANTLTFTMLADTHDYDPSSDIEEVFHSATSKNVEAASAWAKLVNNDFVIVAGDLIADGHDKATALSLIGGVLELAEKHAKCPVYALKGNHDTNEYGTNKEVPTARITDTEFYIHANARGEKYGMVVDPEQPDHSYYYVDFPKQKIRMVCLNTSENNPDVDDITSVAIGEFRYSGSLSPTQLAWVANTALRVDEGWAVMLMSHIPPVNVSDLPIEYYNRTYNDQALTGVCKAFVAGSKGTVTAKKLVGNNVYEDVTLSYDFSTQGAREFIGHFCAHDHTDAYNKVDGLNYAMVNCTLAHKEYDESPERHVYGDETTLSLNSFIIDRETRTVKCIKIGAAPADDFDGWVDSFTW